MGIVGSAIADLFAASHEEVRNSGPYAIQNRLETCSIRPTRNFADQTRRIT